MALIKKTRPDFISARGTPASDTLFDLINLASMKHVQFIVKQGSTSPLEVSLDGTDVHMSLPAPQAGMNDAVYTFLNLRASRLHVRKTGASVEIYGYCN